MYIRYLFLDDRNRTSPREGVVESPTLGTVRDSISKLDGIRYSQLFLSEFAPSEDSELPFLGQALMVFGGDRDLIGCYHYPGSDDPRGYSSGTEFEEVTVKAGHPMDTWSDLLHIRSSVEDLILKFASDGRLPTMSWRNV